MSFIEIVEDGESFELKIGETKFTLRRFDSIKHAEFEKANTKKEKNFRTGQWLKEVDERAVNNDLLDYMIIDWANVKSPTTGKDVPCTRENKIKLPGKAKIQIIEACDADSITTGKKTQTSKSTLSVASISQD